MDPAPTSAGRRRHNPLIGCFQGCLVLLFTIALSFLLIGGMMAVVFEFSPFSSFSGMPVGTTVEEIARSAMADLGENPAIIPAKPAPRYPIDPSVPQPLVVPLVKALDLMRGTPDGDALFNLLVDNDGVHGTRERAGYVALATGLHAIELLFFQGRGGVELNLQYDGPGIDKSEVGSETLFH